MCRFLVYISSGDNQILLHDLLSKPTHSLISQSFNACYHPGFTSKNNARLNGDGMGAAWYTKDRVFCFKSTQPAWSDPNLLELCQCISSSCVFGHVRAASPGSVVSRENCHPFKFGRLSFMHNGHIEAFPQLRRALLGQLKDTAFNAIKGLTDSEHAFALLLSSLPDPGRTTPFSQEELSSAMEHTIAAILSLLAGADIQQGFTSLNFALTDGRTVIATRFCDRWPVIPPPSLYFAFPTTVELALELNDPTGINVGGGEGGPGDGSENSSSTSAPTPGGGGGGYSDAALSPSSTASPTQDDDRGHGFGLDFARREARWRKDEAYLGSTRETAGERALLIASEPATEGPNLAWLAFPANSMLVFTTGSEPQLRSLEGLLGGGRGGQGGGVQGAAVGGGAASI